jgi:hypothetical protein
VERGTYITAHVHQETNKPLTAIDEWAPGEATPGMDGSRFPFKLHDLCMCFAFVLGAFMMIDE